MCFADGRPIADVTVWPMSESAPEGTRVEEHISARMPTRDERRRLQLDDGAPVLVLERALYSDDVLVEVSRSIVAASRLSLVFQTPP